MTKITYFDGDRELYSHNLGADKVMIEDKVVWEKEKLKVGDIVQDIYHKIIGVVVEVYTTNDCVCVDIKSSKIFTGEGYFQRLTGKGYFHKQSLIKIDEPKFEIGDYIRVTNNRISDYQKCGKVIDIKPGVSLVEFSDYNRERISFSKNQYNCHFYWHENKDLEKVK